MKFPPLLARSGLAALVAAAVSPRGEAREEVTPRAREALRHEAAGRWQQALDAVERALAGEPPTPRLLEIEAHCRYQLGDFPGAEEALEKLLALEPRGPDEVRAQYLARLAEVCILQGDEGEALARIEGALGLSEAPAVRRLAVSVYFRAHRFRELLPHAAAVLRVDPRAPQLLFFRGVARARLGDLEGARSDLRRRLEGPEPLRDARFELALVEAGQGRPRAALELLGVILEGDPYDAEAVHQASRQLLSLRKRGPRRTAALLTAYFETLRELQGESSRDHHFQAAGRPLAARLERAARWERLGAYGHLFRELEGLPRERPEVALFLGRFWLRQGLLEEAERAVETGLALRGGQAMPEGKLLGDLRAGILQAHRQVEAAGPGPLEAARRHLAGATWAGAAAALEELLAAAGAAREPALAREAARLLAARESESLPALRFLVRSTEHPSLLVPHLHFLSRLAAATGLPELEERLWGLRALLAGGDGREE